MDLKPPWKSPVVNWHTIGEEAASTMLDLAEKRLTATIESHKDLERKTELLRIVTVPLLTLSLAYLFENADSKDSSLYLICLSIAAIPTLGFALGCIVWNTVTDYKIIMPGASPENTLKKERFDEDRFDAYYLEEQQHLDLVVIQLEVYQNAIDSNMKQNDKRKGLNTLVYWSLGILAFFALIPIPLVLLLHYAASNA